MRPTVRGWRRDSIKAKPGEIEELRDRISASDRFPEQLFDVETWKDQQATTLAAVATELSLLNVVLFLSCGGAGFCILAIFYMIVVDKKRDVGILKSLGAGSYGILQIFLFYALALGLVGIAFGMTLAFWFIAHIQEIADFLSRLMGHEVFDPRSICLPRCRDYRSLDCLLITPARLSSRRLRAFSQWPPRGCRSTRCA